MQGDPREQQANLELRDYLAVLRRRWVAIIVCLALALAIGLGFSLIRPKTYQATSSVVLDSGFSRTILFATQDNIPNIDEQVTTEVDLMRTSTVLDKMAKILGYQPDVDLTIPDTSKESKTRAIQVTASDGSSAAAVKEADDFARAYKAVRRELIAEDLRANIKDNRAALSQLDVQTAQSMERIDELKAQIPKATRDQALILTAERNRLLNNVRGTAIAQRQSAISGRLDLLQTALLNNQGQSIFKINLATVPTAPASPRPRRDGLIALLVGLALGLLVAFTRDYYDDTIRTKDDIERITTNIPVLGIIPAIKPWRNKDEALLETVVRPGSPASEAYRALRTAVEFTGVGREFRLIQVTSAAPGEGKSTTASNLAVSLARSGKEVILVDCDLRRPRAHKFFDLDNGVGFTTLLLGTSSIEESLQRVPDVPGLFVVPSGPLPPNPSELLDSGVTTSRLQLLTKSAQYVIVDSPPILPVADSIILGGHADATLLVIKAKSTNRRSIARSLELLNQVEAPVAGIVLNGVGDEGTYGSDYGYYTKDDPRFSPHLGERSHEMVTGFSDTSGEGGPKAEEEPDAAQDLH